MTLLFIWWWHGENEEVSGRAGNMSWSEVSAKTRLKWDSTNDLVEKVVFLVLNYRSDEVLLSGIGVLPGLSIQCTLDRLFRTASQPTA
jgi:hypothetical protein